MATSPNNQSPQLNRPMGSLIPQSDHIQNVLNKQKKDMLPNTTGGVIIGVPTTKTTKKKKTARKKKTNPKHKGGSNALRSGSDLGNGGGSIGSGGTKGGIGAAGGPNNPTNIALRHKYEALKRDRESRFHDAAWLSSDAPTPYPTPAKFDGATTTTTRSINALAVGDNDGSTTNSVTVAAPIVVPHDTSPSFLEKDYEIVLRALRRNGLSVTRSDISLEGIGCLLEQARKYALELLTDAQEYASYAAGTTVGDTEQTVDVTSADLLLAAKLRQPDDCGLDEFDFCDAGEERGGSAVVEGGYALRSAMEVAEETNRRPLPPIPDTCFNGLVLPVDDISRGGGVSLMGRTYDVVSGMRVEGWKDPHGAGNNVDIGSSSGNTIGGGTGSVSNAAGEGGGADTEGEKPKGGGKTRASYGAHRGRQIHVTLKSKAGEGNDKTAGAGASAEGVQPMEV